MENNYVVAFLKFINKASLDVFIMNPLYVIVHENFLYESPFDRYVGHSQIVTEIERIRREEDFVPADVPKQVPFGLDPARSVRVCGAFYSGYLEGNSPELMCVDQQIEALANAGFNVEVHMPGTLLSFLNKEFPGFQLGPRRITLPKL
tara:strand:+ start:154 stop:597 length:444 start_codon:yes stop_codon:yes gene_type:complete